MSGGPRGVSKGWRSSRAGDGGSQARGGRATWRGGWRGYMAWRDAASPPRGSQRASQEAKLLSLALSPPSVSHVAPQCWGLPQARGRGAWAKQSTELIPGAHALAAGLHHLGEQADKTLPPCQRQQPWILFLCFSSASFCPVTPSSRARRAPHVSPSCVHFPTERRGSFPLASAANPQSRFGSPAHRRAWTGERGKPCQAAAILEPAGREESGRC